MSPEPKTTMGTGQQKLHRITKTGEPDRHITQQEWRTNGRQLRADGWMRPEDSQLDDALEEPVPQTRPA